MGIELTPSVDMKSDAAGSTSSQKEAHVRKMSLKFIFVTPRQLIEKEGREHKLAQVNLHLMTGSTFDLLGHKEDFRFGFSLPSQKLCVGFPLPVYP